MHTCFARGRAATAVVIWQRHHAEANMFAHLIRSAFLKSEIEFSRILIFDAHRLTVFFLMISLPFPSALSLAF